MSRFAIKSVVTRPDGSLHSDREYGWGDPDPDGMQLLVGELLAFKRKVEGEVGKNDDAANLSGTFSCSTDGVVDPTMSFSVAGISYKSLVKLQREFWHAEDRMLREGERRAKNK